MATFTMVRTCIYRCPLPSEAAIERLRKLGAEAVEFNRDVTNVRVYPEDGELVLLLDIRGRDQWMVRRKAPHVAASLLARAGIRVADVRLMDVVKPAHAPQ